MTETNHPIPPCPDSMVYTRLLVTALFWGGTFMAGRSLSQDVAPFFRGLPPICLCLLFLVAMVSYREGSLPRPEKAVSFLVFLGMTGVFLYNFFFFRTQVYPCRPGISHHCGKSRLHRPVRRRFFQEKLSPLRICRILLCVTGAVTVISRGTRAATLLPETSAGASLSSAAWRTGSSIP